MGVRIQPLSEYASDLRPPSDFKVGCLNRAWNKLYIVKWLSEHFVESCTVISRRRLFRGEIAPPIRASDKGGILTNNSTV